MIAIAAVPLGTSMLSWACYPLRALVMVSGKLQVVMFDSGGVTTDGKIKCKKKCSTNLNVPEVKLPCLLGRHR